MRRLIVGVAVLGLAACWLGCGGGGDYSSPKATFQSMWNAAKAGNRDGVIDCMWRPMRKTMPEMLKMQEDLVKEFPAMKDKMGGDMVAQMQEQAEKAKVEIGAEKITGDTATLEVTTDGDKETFNFVKEGSTWRLKPPGDMPSIEDLRKKIDKAREAMKALKK